MKDYKDSILEQLDGVYEDTKFRLESYYRNLVKQMKEKLAENIESKGDTNPAEALTKITNDHHEMLVATVDVAWQIGIANFIYILLKKGKLPMLRKLCIKSLC